MLFLVPYFKRIFSDEENLMLKNDDFCSFNDVRGCSHKVKVNLYSHQFLIISWSMLYAFWALISKVSAVNLKTMAKLIHLLC